MPHIQNTGDCQVVNIASFTVHPHLLPIIEEITTEATRGDGPDAAYRKAIIALAIVSETIAAYCNGNPDVHAALNAEELTIQDLVRLSDHLVQTGVALVQVSN